MDMSYDIKSRLHRTFIDNVRARRLELGLTQTDVANRMKIAQSSYAQIESGRRTPTLEMIERVAKALKSEPLELLSTHALA
jgi:transcriptional regulator with XRE-family HTH domain